MLQAMEPCPRTTSLISGPPRRKRYFGAFLTVAALISLAMPAESGNFLAGQSSGVSEQEATLSGIVVDAESGTPISKATIVLRPAQGAQETATARLSGADGQFSMANIVPGEYVISAQKPGFVQEPEGGQRTPSLLVHLEAGTGNPAVKLRLSRCPVIAGRVTDSSGEPLIGANVNLVQNRLIDGQFAMMAVAQTVTNDLGEYRISGIRPGSYYISAFFRDAASMFGLRVRPDKSEGSLTNEDYVTTWYPGVLMPDSAAAVRAKAGEILSHIDIHVAAVRCTTIEGIIDNPPHGTAVRVNLDPSDISALGARQVFTVDPGKKRFFFKSVPPGEYVIRAQAGREFAALRQVTVSGGSFRDVVVTLEPAPAITAAVKMDGQTSLPEGLQIIFAGTSLPMRLPVRPGADGRFNLQAIPIDTYHVSVTDPSGRARLKAVHAGTQELSPNRLQLEGSLDLVFLVSSATVETRGIAVDSSSDPVTRGIAVAVANGSGTSYLAPIGKEGKFTFGPLLPGDYRILCFSDVTEIEDVPREVLAGIATQGLTVTLKADQNEPIRATAIKALAQ